MDHWLCLADSCGSNASTKKTVDKSKRKREYDDSFLQYGFTCSCEDGVEKPLCLICNETLSAESLKPSKLKRHLNTKHAESSDKTIQYFERLLKFSKKQKQFTENFFTVNERYMRASYEASYLIAKSTKPFSVGENLVLPAAVKMSEIVHGKKYGDEIRKIPLSNDTVARRIAEISMIHREALAAKHMSFDLDAVLRDVVKIINYIKNNALNSRLFANLCKEQDSNYTSLLMHAEIRWLSRGYSIQRLLQLKDERVMFLTEQKSAFAELFLNDAWVLKLCYLSDIFGKLNDLNISLQGNHATFLLLKIELKLSLKSLLYGKIGHKMVIWKCLLLRMII